MSQNWNTPRFKPGDKVHYVFDDKTFENGIVTKCNGQLCTRVVFECEGNWDRYMDYPAEICPDNWLVLGWTEENTNVT